MADSELTSDSWVMVDSPEATEQPPAQPEPEPATEPEKPAEPETQPEPEPATEPEPEPEQPAEPEPEKPEQPAEPEPEPEQPAEPEPEPEQPAEPEPEPEQPAEPEPEPVQPDEPDSKPEEPPEPKPEPEQPAEPEAPTEPESQAEPEPEPEPEPTPAEPEPAPEQPAEPEPEPKEPEQPAAEEDTPKPSEDKGDDKPTEDKPDENKPAEDKPDEDKSDEEGDVVVEVEVEIGGDAPAEKPNEEVIPEPGEDINLSTYLQLCQIGCDMIKVKKSKAFPRYYRLENDLLSIIWNSKHKPVNKAKIAVANIKEVRAGRSTDSFKASKDTHPEEVCFSIIHLDGSNFKTLDLAAPTTDERTAWVEGLKAMLRTTAHEGKDVRSKVRERWLKDLFDGADKDSSGTLDVKEVLSMMHRLNVGVSSKEIKRKFKKADDGAAEGGELDGKLNFEEFCTLFKDLASRPEIQVLFNKYSSKMEWLTVRDLQKFLQLEQGAENPSLEFCTQLIQKYEPTDEGKAQGWMSLDGFTQFMLGPENDIINIDRSTVVYQDMTQPLSHYYIASSHNTYLLEDQLKGPSSCEAYIRALRKGCRCVELDCWDGPDGEPIIYHGHTLTSKILFEDVIKAIKEHAFAVSAYPVILSIENHCSIPQQHRMADIMKDVLGDMLHDVDRDESREMLPSPEELKRKILVKGKKLKKEQEEQEDDDGEVTDEDEAEEIDEAQLAKIKPKEEAKPAETKPVEDKPAEQPAEDKPSEDKPAEDKPAKDKPAEDKPAEDKPAEDKPAEGKPAEDKPAEDKPAAAAEPKDASPRKQRSMSFRSRQRKSTITEKPKKKIKLSARLSKCVNYVQSVHFPGIDGYDGVTTVSAKCWEMSSFGESKALKLGKESAVRYVTYNKRQVSRTYPKGSRVDSSNYDPTPMWNTGCQIVALNYQTPGKPMDLNEGKFRDNGGCGYILKPSIMRQDLSRFDHNQRNIHFSGFGPKVITITVISGQQLPKPGDKKGEVIDPYVVLQMAGAECDTQRVKTKTISDNGFNPQWNQSFHMCVKYPELAVLRIKVMDADWGPNPDDFIGSYALPVSCLVPGYRHVHLYKSGNKLETGSLFLHVQIQDFVAPHRAFGKTKTFLRIKKSREYPEHHQTGHQSIDVHFRDIPGPLHRAVDMREDFTFALLHFKELIGHGPHASLGDCVELLAAKAKSAGVKIQLEKTGQTDDTKVYHMSVVQSEGGAAASTSLQQMLDSFNRLNTTIEAILNLAQPTINELEKIAKEAKEQEGGLREHLREGPVPSKRPDLVVDHFARTMFTLTSEASQLSATKDQAEDTLKKLFAAAQSAGIDLKSS